MAEYNALPDAQGGKVLNIDTARELSPDYATSRESRALLSPAVHEPASFFIKQLYADRLAEMPPDSTVMFTSGGTGVGKSTAIIVVGLALAVPVMWTWWQVVFGERLRRRKWLREVTRATGARLGVLVVNVLPGKDVMHSVRKHLAAQPALASLPEDRIVTVSRDAALKPEHTDGLARKLCAAARRLMDAGVDVVNLFHAGPDVSALMAGAELCNGPRVLLHHYDQGVYRLFGPLEPLRD